MKDEWMEYSGDGFPVDKELTVEVIYKNGYSEVISAEYASWDEAKKYRVQEDNEEEEVQQKPEGEKHDKGKDRFSLIPLDALQEVIKVLEHGADKYEVDNWKRVEDSENRYYDAIFRHLFAYRRGETKDKESRLSHLAHATCCIMFLLDGEVNNEN